MHCDEARCHNLVRTSKFATHDDAPPSARFVGERTQNSLHPVQARFLLNTNRAYIPA